MNTHVALTATSGAKSAEAICAWMVDYLAAQLKVAPASLDVTVALDEYGVDSATAVRMMGDLEDYIGCELSPSLPYEFPTIEALSGHLADLAQA